MSLIAIYTLQSTQTNVLQTIAQDMNALKKSKRSTVQSDYDQLRGFINGCFISGTIEYKSFKDMNAEALKIKNEIIDLDKAFIKYECVYKQVRAGGFGVDPSLAAKRKRTAMILIFVFAVIVVHKLLTILGLAS